MGSEAPQSVTPAIAGVTGSCYFLRSRGSRERLTFGTVRPAAADLVDGVTGVTLTVDGDIAVTPLLFATACSVTGFFSFNRSRYAFCLHFAEQKSRFIFQVLISPPQCLQARERLP